MRTSTQTLTDVIATILDLAKPEDGEIEERFLPHSFFVGFAPAEEPKVSVLVLVEHGKAGSLVAAPMARKILNFYAANIESFAGAEKPVLRARFNPSKRFRKALRDAFAKPEPESEAPRPEHPPREED